MKKIDDLETEETKVSARRRCLMNPSWNQIDPTLTIDSVIETLLDSGDKKRIGGWWMEISGQSIMIFNQNVVSKSKWKQKWSVLFKSFIWIINEFLEVLFYAHY